MTPGELAQSLAALERGSVVAAATETYCGLLADARRADAIDRIFGLKERDRGKALALLLPDRASWSSLVCEIPTMAEALADRFWPGPLTIALAARKGIDARLVVGGAVAARLPGPSDASEIARAFGAPLTATSANVAGGAPCVCVADLERCFRSAIEQGGLVVVSGEAKGEEPSTIVAIEDGRLRIVRRGRISETELRETVRCPP